MSLPRASYSPLFVRDELGLTKLPGWKVIHEEGHPTRVYEVVTDDYEIIQHKSVIQMVDTVLGKLGYQPKDTAITLEGRFGARMFYKLLLREFEITPGDKIAVGLMITNSYDRSLGLSVYLYALRLVCLNQMVFGREILKLKALHRGEATPERFVNNIIEATRQMGEVEVFLGRLINAKIPREQIEDFLEKLQVAEKYRKLITRRIGWADEVNAWELYNAYTWVFTHRADMSFQRKAEYLRKLNIGIRALINVQERGNKR